MPVLILNINCAVSRPAAVQVVGEGRCPIVDTWWQTETGAAMITPLPYAWATKPGSATLPFFGVQPVLLTDKGEEIQGPGEGCFATHVTLFYNRQLLISAPCSCGLQYNSTIQSYLQD
jgi:hypothetical protein